MYCKELDFSQTTTVAKEIYKNLSVNDEIDIIVYKTLGQKTMSIDFKNIEI